MCWLADADNIYTISLLTYDLELVVNVAQHTNKDPKEYLPYLNSLKAIHDEPDRRAKICTDLKNFQQAATELSKGDHN